MVFLLVDARGHGSMMRDEIFDDIYHDPTSKIHAEDISASSISITNACNAIVPGLNQIYRFRTAVMNQVCRIQHGLNNWVF